MTIESFIDKALDGSWYFKHPFPNDLEYWSEHDKMAVLLDPEAWKAVGKVEGWKFNERNQCGGYNTSRETKGGIEAQKSCAHCQMHRMIDARAEGKTIEEYLETL